MTALKQKILVTGAGGFVGTRLTQHLENHGYNVLGVYRKRSLTLGEIPKKRFIVENIDGATDWKDAFSEVNQIIHLAARVHIMTDKAHDPLSEFRRVNVEGTLNLARQAADAGVKRFVFLSSVKVNGEGMDFRGQKPEVGRKKSEGRKNTEVRSVPYTETDEPCPQDAYAVSKWEAEQGLMEIGEGRRADGGRETGGRRMEVVIIRPPLVYGPGVKANFLKLMQWLHKGIPLPLGAIHNKRSLVALDNLVDLIVTCVVHPAAANQIFFVSDGKDISTTELLKRMAVALDVPARLLPVPAWMLKAVAVAAGKGDIAQRLLGSLQVDITKAKQLLGWSPPVTLDEGLEKTARWFLESKQC